MASLNYKIQQIVFEWMSNLIWHWPHIPLVCLELGFYIFYINIIFWINTFLCYPCIFNSSLNLYIKKESNASPKSRIH